MGLQEQICVRIKTLPKNQFAISIYIYNVTSMAGMPCFLYISYC